MARNNQRSRNNNPSGRNQYSGGVMDMARDRPFAAAGMAAAAVGAGVFLWSKRNQISEQISNLSDQFSEWSQNTGSGSSDEFESDDTAGLATGRSTNRGSRKSQSEISEEALTLKETGSQRGKAGAIG
jgi:hypothetical protein